MYKKMNDKFEPNLLEDEIYKKWEDNGYFKCKIDKSKDPYVIVMPPPNITGKLHMGHALDQTIQDVIIRYNRMKGTPTMWLPGTDHASIATEAKVVDKLKKEGKTKEEIGREEFLKQVWAWKKEYGGQITNQLRKLGCSCDWSKERFTLDKGCSDAVIDVFIKLYNKGLLYRGKRITNWCPVCKTSLSENEVEYETKDSFLWYIKYPVENSDEYVTVATTRPETMLGDSAVAVNPNDERYTHLVGKRVLLPIVNKYIPIVADDYVDMKFGTGAVKITPAHDPNDFEVGIRHNLEVINILNKDATLNENAGMYEGMSSKEARDKIVERLKQEGYLIKIKPYVHNVGTCYRCHSVIEPYISMQWYVKMKDLVKPAIDAVKNGEIKFIPKRFEKNYFNWMENIQDWCISRQLWWGHRIPAYYCDKCSKIVVAKQNPGKCECGGKFIQDEDTLDTWFSSALWPFSTFGWPDTQSEEYKYFYPTTTLVTGYDIITFWVSKMIFSGIAYTGKVPFKNVYIHGLVRDEQGRKMSKSLGNGIDPLEVISNYGTDALRFSLIQNISAGNDVRYIPKKVESAKNFTNKLWNAAKFVNSYLDDLTVENVDNKYLMLEDKWILNKLSNLIKIVTKNIEKFEIGVAIQQIYDFIWFDFCDWYIEMVKTRLYNENNKSRQSAIWVLNYVLLNLIKLLHPFMPYITEEIYQNLKHSEESIMISKWPEAIYKFNKENKLVDEILEAIKQIRNVRANSDISSSKKVDTKVVIIDKSYLEAFKSSEHYIKRLAYIENIEYLNNNEQIDKKYIPIHTENLNIYLDFSKVINKDEQILKLEKEKKNILNELNRANSMLENKTFVEKAPKALVEKEKEKIDKYSQLLKKVEESMKQLD